MGQEAAASWEGREGQEEPRFQPCLSGGRIVRLPVQGLIA